MIQIEKMPKYLAEMIGTFCLVFGGCGAMIVDQLTAGRVSHLGVSLVFGLVVLAMVYSVGHISGAHLNPAVTLGFYSAKRLEGREVPFYILFQIAGALLASLSLRAIFGAGTQLGLTVPSGSWGQSFILEGILTFMLMFVVMGVATDHRAKGMMAGVAIGATICLEAVLAGPISGASMNPARSLGPALASGVFHHQWLYWVAPIGGSLLGASAYKLVQCQIPGKASGSACC